MTGCTVKLICEKRTSRMCARCFTPFELRTLNHRFKVCDWCLPNQDDWPDGLKLPTKIVTKKTKRKWQHDRNEMRNEWIANPNQTAAGFVSKMICYRKYWQQNVVYDVNGNYVGLPNNNNNNQDDYDFTADYEPEDFFDQPFELILNTHWHRDTTAAKLILYKGKHLIIEIKLN